MLLEDLLLHDRDYRFTTKFDLEQNRSIYKETRTIQSDPIDQTVCSGQLLIGPSYLLDLTVRS